MGRTRIARIKLFHTWKLESIDRTVSLEPAHRKAVHALADLGDSKKTMKDKLRVGSKLKLTPSGGQIRLCKQIYRITKEHSQASKSTIRDRRRSLTSHLQRLRGWHPEQVILTLAGTIVASRIVND